MYLEINPEKGIATLKQGEGITLGTLEFETYHIIDDSQEKQNIMDMAFYNYDLNSKLTVKDFLKKLLLTLW